MSENEQFTSMTDEGEDKDDVEAHRLAQRIEAQGEPGDEGDDDVEAHRLA